MVLGTPSSRFVPRCFRFFALTQPFFSPVLSLPSDHNNLVAAGNRRFQSVKKDPNLLDVDVPSMVEITFPGRALNDQARRFEVDDNKHLKLLRCSQLDVLLQELEDYKNWHKVFVYGPSGSGKSHLLVQLAHVFAKKHAGDTAEPRVVYIQNFAGCMDPLRDLRERLIESFFNDEETLAAIENAAVSSDWESFAHFAARLNVIYITDQWNALQGEDLWKKQWKFFVNKFSDRGKLVYSASANQTSVTHYAGKQLVQAFTHVVPAGLTLDETKTWIASAFPERVVLKKENWDALVEITGLVDSKDTSWLNSLAVKEFFSNADANVDVAQSLVTFATNQENEITGALIRFRDDDLKEEPSKDKFHELVCSPSFFFVVFIFLLFFLCLI